MNMAEIASGRHVNGISLRFLGLCKAARMRGSSRSERPGWEASRCHLGSAGEGTVARGGRQQLVRAGVGGLAAGGRPGLGVFGGFGGIGEVEFVWTRRRNRDGMV